MHAFKDVTHFVQDFERNGFQKDQAIILAEKFAEILDSNMASKNDMSDLKSDLKSDISDLSSKIDLLSNKIDNKFKIQDYKINTVIAFLLAIISNIVGTYFLHR